VEHGLDERQQIFIRQNVQRVTEPEITIAIPETEGRLDQDIFVAA
jgi:hypothetical protein